MIVYEPINNIVCVCGKKKERNSTLSVSIYRFVSQHSFQNNELMNIILFKVLYREAKEYTFRESPSQNQIAIF